MWKAERFKYEKMGIKGLPFGYLQFSRAFGGNHAHSRALPPSGSTSEHGHAPSSFWTGLHSVLFESVAGVGHADADERTQNQNARPTVSSSGQLTPMDSSDKNCSEQFYLSE